MKAEISRLGYLTVIAQNELESFALNKWHEENINQCTLAFKNEHPRCFFIDSKYPKITIFHRIKVKLQLFLYR